MEIDLYKAIPIGVSLIAIFISIATIFITRQNLKRQLRLAKLEEILEILLFLESYYRGLFLLFKDIEQKVELLENRKESPKYLNDSSTYKKSFTKLFDYETLINKISRLNVLAKAYLPNKKNLKNKALTIADVYFAMYTYVNFDGNLRTKSAYNIIPKPTEMKALISQLSDQIIFEMKLGYKNTGDREYYKYYKSQFQKDLSTAISLERKKLEREKSTSGNSGFMR
ncbi:MULTISPECIES: hypothetical protein [unclassified Flavobacterium]|uniref:hypothetical protein n=1 Tax=unclassified Flavobacterium TaxID=196869 RepID=UPI000959E132|nr:MULTISPECIES: hypothetical protein [unclassified Flavobacterium]MBN9284835.1 hypothetical protein [Flavobacterium sp.]OJV71330.1 MAG: hypothetical protein BGO42_07900 [Flavobacterium sp. 40-81]